MRFNYLLVGFSYVLQFHSRCFVRIQHKLVFSYYETGRNQTFTVLLDVFHVEQPFTALAGLAQIKFHAGSLMRCHIQVFNASAADSLTIFQYFPFQCVCRQVTEEVFVVYLDFSLCQIAWSCPDILIEVLYFVRMRIRFAVRADKSVVTEVLVARIIHAVEVASISINHLAVLACPADRLVYEVPDESTLIFRILTNQVPVFFESTL